MPLFIWPLIQNYNLILGEEIKVKGEGWKDIKRVTEDEQKMTSQECALVNKKNNVLIVIF